MHRIDNINLNYSAKPRQTPRNCAPSILQILAILRFIREDHHDKCRKAYPGKARLPHPHGRDRGDPQCQAAAIRAAAWTSQRCCLISISRTLNVDPAQPKMRRTATVWCCPRATPPPALYAALAERGYLPGGRAEDPAQDRQLPAGPPQHEHACPAWICPPAAWVRASPPPAAWHWVPSCKQQPVSVYAIVGDGEVEEGECWEAFMFASHYKPLQPLRLPGPQPSADRRHHRDGHGQRTRWKKSSSAFNFNVLTINGHDYDAIESAMQGFPRGKRQAHLHHSGHRQGQGRFLYGPMPWHGTARAPTMKSMQIAMQELNAAYAALEQEEK